MGFLSAYQEQLAALLQKPSLDRTRAFLDLLENSMDFGSANGRLEVQVIDRQQDQATRWHYWQEVRDNDWWVERINQRSIGLPEVVFDLDPSEGESAESFHERMTHIVRRLQDDGAVILSNLHTGSRGRHVHCLVPELLSHDRETIRNLKLRLFKEYGADQAKAAPRCMILLEGSVNSKTGERKGAIA